MNYTVNYNVNQDFNPPLNHPKGYLEAFCKYAGQGNGGYNISKLVGAIGDISKTIFGVDGWFSQSCCSVKSAAARAGALPYAIFAIFDAKTSIQGVRLHGANTTRLAIAAHKVGEFVTASLFTLGSFAVRAPLLKTITPWSSFITDAAEATDEHVMGNRVKEFYNEMRRLSNNNAIQACRQTMKLHWIACAKGVAAAVGGLFGLLSLYGLYTAGQVMTVGLIFLGLSATLLSMSKHFYENCVMTYKKVDDMALTFARV